MPAGTFDDYIRHILSRFGVGDPTAIQEAWGHNSRQRHAYDMNEGDEADTLEQMMSGMDNPNSGRFPEEVPIPNRRGETMMHPDDLPAEIPPGGITTSWDGPPELGPEMRLPNGEGVSTRPMPSTLEELLADPYWSEELKRYKWGGS